MKTFFEFIRAVESAWVLDVPVKGAWITRDPIWTITQVIRVAHKPLELQINATIPSKGQ